MYNAKEIFTKLIELLRSSGLHYSQELLVGMVSGKGQFNPYSGSEVPGNEILDIYSMRYSAKKKNTGQETIQEYEELIKNLSDSNNIKPDIQLIRIVLQNSYFIVFLSLSNEPNIQGILKVDGVGINEIIERHKEYESRGLSTGEAIDFENGELIQNK